MASAPLYTWSQSQLQPAYNDKAARQVNVALGQGVYARGTVLGQISSANVSAVHTITVSGAPTHSTLLLTGLPGGLIYQAPQDVTPAALATALNALLGANSVVVTGTYAAGSGGTYVITWGGTYASQPIPTPGVSGTFVGGTSPAVAIAQTTAGVGPNGSFVAYNAANNDGSQNARGLLVYPCTVNYAGQVYISTEIPGVYQQYAPMYRSGAFRTEDLTGLDANAVAVLNGLLAVGTVTQGILEFGV